MKMKLMLLFLLLPAVCFACTPVIPLMMVFLGPLPWGAIATASAFGLLIAVFLKCVVFLLKSDFRSWRAVVYMCAANFVSTILGVVMGGIVSVGLFALMSLPISFVIIYVLAEHFRIYPFFKDRSKAFIVAVLGLAYVVGIVSFVYAMGFQSSHPVVYWILKCIFTTLLAGSSFMLTVLCEEAVISYLYGLSHTEGRSFFEPVVWANVVAFIVVFALAAAKALPQRLASPDFLIGP